MNKNNQISRINNLTLLFALFLSACAAPQPAPTSVPSIATQFPTSIPTTAIQSPTLVAATVTATPSTTGTNPSPRGSTTQVYDAESDQIIMFGGQSGNMNRETSFNNETWAYDVKSNKWTQMKPDNAPSKRAGDSLAYDAESDRVILFGGLAYDKNRLNWGLTDTWAYDYNTNTWKEMAKGPANHLGARLAYDAESDRVILFGGISMVDIIYVNDTWAYDFNTNTWTEMKPKTSPRGRNFQAMTYDSKADRVLVWGGLDEQEEKPVDESVWAYDFNKNSWTEMKPGDGAHPAGRDYSKIVYNAKADRTILYGGNRGGTETWSFDYNTNTWTKLEPATNPGILADHSLVYSTIADRVILFGGFFRSSMYNPSDAIWIFDINTTTWSNIIPKP